MASSLQPKRKKKRRQNGLPNSLFTRLQLVMALDDFPDQLEDASSSYVDSYDARVLGSCTLAWHLPTDPLSVSNYRRCSVIPGQVPYYVPPLLPCPLPSDSRPNSRIVKPTLASILPLLLTARQVRVDVRQYDFVSERNSLRKFMLNDEDYIISVMRFDNTIFLRRHAAYYSIDRNDKGYRFEEMCTTTSNYLDGDYHQLTEGRIGELRTLILAETDAIKQENGEAIELKSHKNLSGKWMQHDWWSQAYLSGTNTIIHGRQSNNQASEISHLVEYRVSQLSDNQSKIESFQRLHRILQFLRSNVIERRTYLLRRHHDPVAPKRATLLALLDDELNGWVHHVQYILPEGRAKWWHLGENADKEEEEIEPEEGSPLLTPIGACMCFCLIQSLTGHLCICSWSCLGKYLCWFSSDYEPELPPLPTNEYRDGSEIGEAEDPSPEEETKVRAAEGLAADEGGEKDDD
ncbi:unnamed protein product [Rotaria magnacalcarata]|uniref:Decapping nuclease n=1 Tax=Rotaria magnacalcarata TaxID=392030 RepID=A0A816UZY2_9BILA|nr:unnamed protein product [Rotaria magnacalcarata]